MKTSAIFSIVAIALTITLTSASADEFMTKPRISSHSANLPAVIEMEVDEEDYVEVAEWMFDVEAFESIKEEMISIEDWMLDVEAFGLDTTTTLANQVFEEYIAIEDWMLNPENF